ncbi:MAG: citrate transporter [Magnetococcales bacterium]|nr:citrate transporter [Magnetococcales bacterium]
MAAEGQSASQAIIHTVFGIPIDFILFALILLGVATQPDRTFQVAMTGLAVVLGYKLFISGFRDGPGLVGLGHHMRHEWVTLVNLLCLLLGFSLLANHFEKSGVPEVLPRYLPKKWMGGFVLLLLVCIISSFLDNIAAALIGGTIARIVFRGKVHIGYLAGIVAASNAGGAGSVVGDTTTTMMWIAGVSPLDVLHAYVAAIPATIICGIPAAIQQEGYSPLSLPDDHHGKLDSGRFFVVFFVLVVAIIANYTANAVIIGLADNIPIIGISVWVALLVMIPVRKPDWSLIPSNLKGTFFLLALVMTASLMPVEELPRASWQTAFGLGFLSAVFDNIPLTALGIAQGGFDWGMLAYCVGFGGSMIWFGSSAGVGLSNMYPESRSTWSWLKNGWHVTVAYIIGFFILLSALGWQPGNKGHAAVNPPSLTQAQTMATGAGSSVQKH